jgi:hypothetical protein
MNTRTNRSRFATTIGAEGAPAEVSDLSAVRRGRRWWLLVAVAVVVVAVLAAAATAFSQAGPRRDDVAREKLLIGPATLLEDPAGAAQWKDFARDSDGAMSFRQWAGPSGSLMHAQALKYGGPIRGWYHYTFADPTGKYADDYSGSVREVDVPAGIGADDAKLFCGNIGHSTPGTLDDCQIWGYWAHYGQYVVDFEITDLPSMTQADFTAMAQRLDAATAAALPK